MGYSGVNRIHLLMAPITTSPFQLHTHNTHICSRLRLCTHCFPMADRVKLDVFFWTLYRLFLFLITIKVAKRLLQFTLSVCPNASYKIIKKKHSVLHTLKRTHTNNTKYTHFRLRDAMYLHTHTSSCSVQNGLMHETIGGQ